MKPEAQRIAIAEACGWRAIPATVCGAAGFVAVSPSGQSFNPEASCLRSAALIRVIPDYLTDLNAILEAVRSLPSEEQWRLFTYLAEIVDEAVPAATASAAQWCEAYLKTRGKWEDDK